MWDGGIYFKYSEVAVGEVFFFWWGGTPFFQMIMQESVALLYFVSTDDGFGLIHLVFLF